MTDYFSQLIVLTEGFSKLFEYEFLGNSLLVFRLPDIYSLSHLKVYSFDLNWAKWVLLHIISNNIMYLKIPLI